MAVAQNTESSKAQQRQERLEKQKFDRMIARIRREFDRKFFIGDITISDQEYELLLKPVRLLCQALIRDGNTELDFPPLAVALVQIGMRHYQGQHFWPAVAQALDMPLAPRNQTVLGEAFTYILRRHGKYIISESERVQTILFHGFVSNYYSRGLFELLFQYYSRDLERDIYRNTTEQMQLLMDTLAIKAAQEEAESEHFANQFMVMGSRAYRLRRHTLQAISAQPIPSRVRLRRLLRLIDRAFWKDDVPKNPSSRLTILFKEWMAESPSFKREYQLYQMGEIRNRGKKHFSAPYLFANIAASHFEIRLPAQIVSEADADGLLWEVRTAQRTFRLDADTYPALTGFKTEEYRAAISTSELFGELRCQLVRGDAVIRRFGSIPASDVRFFDMEGDYAARLFRIPMCAYTRNDMSLASTALLSHTTLGSMIRWDFEFQQGDLVVLPDGTGMVVGDQFSDGYILRGRVSGVAYTDGDGRRIPVYQTAPDLLLTLPKSKRGGTILYCNETPYKLSDCQYTEFDARDSKGVQAILLPAAQFAPCCENGVSSIILDIPGTAYAKEFPFVLVRGLTVDFDGAPYVFEERGTIQFPEGIRVDCDHERIPGENGFQFDLDGNTTDLSVTIDGQIPLTIQIPMLSWSSDRKDWKVLPVGELWHTEFFDIKKLYLRGPFSRVSLSTDADAPDDEDTEQRMVPGELGADGVFTVDLTRFRSWLTRDVMRSDIFLKLGSWEYTFAAVYTRSLVAAFDVTADYDAGVLTCLCDIIGKADYYIDILHVDSDTEIAQKLPIVGGRLELQDRLRSGLYRFTLYEAEEDDSGFDDPIFEELATKDRKLVNLNDFSGQYLTILKFKSTHSSNLYTEFSKEYIVRELEKVGQNQYSGMLLEDRKETGLRLEIAFPQKDDPRLFHVLFWHEEEETMVPFIFDRSLGILVTDDDLSLRCSERYRRFRELYEEDFIYFGFLKDQLPDPPKRISHQGTAHLLEIEAQKRRTPIEKMGFSNRAFYALKRRNIQTAGQLSDLTAQDILKLHNVGQNEIEHIAERMARLGLSFDKPDFHSAEESEDEEPHQETAQPAPDPISAEGEQEMSVSAENDPSIPIGEMGFSSAVLLALMNMGVSTAADISALTPFALKRLPHGHLEEVKRIMAGLKLRLRLS